MIKIIEQRRLDFINTELSYFAKDPNKRAYNKETQTCMYWDKTTGNKCVIGKHIPEDKYNEHFESKLLQSIDKNGERFIFNLLPLEIQELGLYFLQDCQLFHDYKYNFNETGLSQQGLETINYLKERYCNNNGNNNR